MGSKRNGVLWEKGKKIKFVEEMKKVKGSLWLSLHSLKKGQQNLFPEEKSTVPSSRLPSQPQRDSTKNEMFS